MQTLRVVIAALLSHVLAMAPVDDATTLKFSDCPPALRRARQAEARTVNIASVSREKDADGETVYEARVGIGGRTYAVAVYDDGTLAGMNLALDDVEVPLDRCPDAVRETLQREALGEKV